MHINKRFENFKLSSFNSLNVTKVTRAEKMTGSVDELRLELNPRLQDLQTGSPTTEKIPHSLMFFFFFSPGFVRLEEASLLDDVLEVTVPVRFVFVILGPSSVAIDYHEIGRSIGTLMSNQVSGINRHFSRSATNLTEYYLWR